MSWVDKPGRTGRFPMVVTEALAGSSPFSSPSGWQKLMARALKSVITIYEGVSNRLHGCRAFPVLTDGGELFLRTQVG